MKSQTLLKNVININLANTNSNIIIQGGGNFTTGQNQNSATTTSSSINTINDVIPPTLNINLIIILIACLLSLCCLSCIIITCYKCYRKNNSTFNQASLYPIQNVECHKDIPIHNTFSNSVVRKLSYITPVKTNRYIDRPVYEQQRCYTMNYHDEEYVPRMSYTDRNFTEIPSRRIKYIEY